MSIQEILLLSQAKRLEIAEQIWNSLQTENLEITEAQKSELDSRKVIDETGNMFW